MPRLTFDTQTATTQRSQHSSTRFHLIMVKYCEDTRLQNQLSAVQEQHKGLYSTLQGASDTLHTILLGVGGTICNNHTLEPFNGSTKPPHKGVFNASSPFLDVREGCDC